MAQNVLVARRRLETNEFRADVTVDGVTKTIAVAAGDYFMDAASAAESLVAAIDAALEAQFVAPNEDFTVTFDLSTGAVTISCTTGTFDGAGWNWNTAVYGTAFRDWVGFGTIGNFSGVTTRTGVRSQGLIYVGSKGRTGYERHEKEQTGDSAKAESGAVAKIFKDDRRSVTSFTYDFEPVGQVSSPVYKSGTFDDEAAVIPWCWDDFWGHCSVHPFRLYSDVSSAIGSPLGTYDLDAGTSGRLKSRHKDPGNEAYWIIRLGLDLYVAAA